jgi:diguanylate cyclase (GGDEF)-like protein
MRKAPASVLPGVAQGGLRLSNDLALCRGQARLLFAHATGSLVVSAAAGLCLVLMTRSPPVTASMAVWLAVMLAVVALRGFDVLVLHPARATGAFDGRREVLRFTVGVAATSLVWAAFPVLFLPAMAYPEKCALSAVLAGMAGGSITALGAYRPAALISIFAQLLPLSAMLAVGHESKYYVMAGLVFAMLLAMIAHSRTTNRAILGSLALSLANQALLRAAERQREEVQDVNTRLTAAQAALNDSNRSLEQRITARTADLEREVAARIRYADALSCLANTDPLTGLCNRTNFAGRLARMLAAADADGEHCAVLFLDLDGFKQINDVRGHEAGDRVLQAVAGLLAARAGGVAELARWGGDEFVVAMTTQPGSPAARRLADDLRDALSTPLQAGLDVVRIDVTIGVALFPDHGKTQDELIRAADVAMYYAKNEGGGRVALFDHSLASVMAERHVLQQALREAIDSGQLSLVFQPIVSAQNGACEAMEALARWQHPVRGMIGPAVFIPLAEQSGQIQSIGTWVLREACREAASWPGCGPSGRAPAVTVNVSVAQVLSATLLGDVEAALRDSGLPAGRLQLEITESMFVGDHVRVIPVFQHLRRRGIRILLDDFGTGFSSLAYLGKLPIDVIKIDQSFVRAAERDGFAVINAILSIARAMSMTVTAEGVETPIQRTVLASIGVDRLQGYLISRPLPATDVSSWLERHAAGLQIAGQAVA